MPPPSAENASHQQQGQHAYIQGSSSTSTDPYRQPRKQLPKEQWEALRPLISSQYIDEKKTVPQIVKLLDDRGIRTSVRAIRGHIAAWRLNCKNNRIDLRHLKAIHRKQRLREQQGRPQAVFRVGGRLRSWSEIRNLQRVSDRSQQHGTSQSDASTPSDLEVLSPSSVPRRSASPSTRTTVVRNWPPPGVSATLIRRPNTPPDKQTELFTLNAIDNWYQSLLERGPTQSVADFDYYDLFWDTHDALGLALQGVKAGWEALYSIGNADRPRASQLIDNPKCFVMALQRISWLPAFALSGDDTLAMPDDHQQRIINVVQLGLERELSTLHANHPLETLFRMVAGQSIPEEFGQHVLRLALQHFQQSRISPVDAEGSSVQRYNSEAIEVQTLFASTLTMLGKHHEAQDLLIHARRTAAMHGDKIRELAASSALATLWAFMWQEDLSYLMKSYELHRRVWDEARTTVLAQVGIGRYMLYGLADLCRVLEGHEEEAVGLFEEAIALHDADAVQKEHPNVCWLITQVRHLYRLYGKMGREDEAVDLRRRFPEAFVMQD